MSDDIEFVPSFKPPVHNTHNPDRQAQKIRKQLDSNPGVWARVYTNLPNDRARVYASRIRRGVLAAYRPVGILDADWAESETKPGTYDVYARRIALPMSEKEATANRWPLNPVARSACAYCEGPHSASDCDSHR